MAQESVDQYTGGEAAYIQLTAPADLWVNSNGCDDAGANLIAGAWGVPDFARTAPVHVEDKS